ncbi:carbohydrate kinase [Hymenopellis radicata]|nr:carbohydrate kinase [Hymenopellis radicata]
MESKEPAIIIVMGVSGTGKSTLGQAIASALDVPFIDGDDLHPAENVAKMSAGTPLNDADREPWLAIIRKTGLENLAKGSVVLACSALRKCYRDILRGKSSSGESTGDTGPKTYFVFIKGSREVLLDRMSKRQGHFMKVTMLDSQLATLESPEGEPDVVVVPVEDSTEVQTEKAKQGLLELRK